MQPTVISPGPCPRCGGELELKANVSSLGKGSKIYFFQCKDCDHIHTVDGNRLNTIADRSYCSTTSFDTGL